MALDDEGFLKDFRKPGKVWMALKKYKHLKMNNRLFLFYFLCTVKVATKDVTRMNMEINRACLKLNKKPA